MAEPHGSGSLKVQLLGPPRIEQGGAAVEVDTRKAVALLAYLAVTRQSHSREALATLFWPDYDQERAHANLRRTLWALNRALGKEWLDLGQESAGVVWSPDFWLDVDAFREHLAACRSHGHSEADVCPDCVSPLTAAAELYRGDFMAGFTLPDSPAFDEWQFFEGESLRRDLAAALERLVHWHAAQREFGQAIVFARRRLGLDPLQESAHRELMALYAWDGQRAAALRQYGECCAVLKAELGIVPDAETTRLYTAIRANQLPPLPVSVAPSLAAGPKPAEPRENLPVQPTPFIGRQSEVGEIAGLVVDPACRLLTLVGPGGAGKTRLALESARRILAARRDTVPFHDGVYFVPLAPVSAVRYLVPAIADSVGFAFFQRKGDEPKRQMLNYLREKNVLLILDSFEHLIAGAGLVSDLLEHAPGVRIMITSRERLNVRWEWVFPVEGLEFPMAGDRAIQSLERYDAIRLFLQLGRQASAGFVPSEADMADVARICQLLEGMPLGIELAAAWVKMLSCHDIADEISRSLDFLRTSMRDIPERHRSLRAAFDHSWQLLSESERRVLAGLSVFAGGFDREAAEQVAGASLELLSALVDKSLLVRPRSGRYAIHEVVSQFASSRLDSDPKERNAAKDRHCAYYAAFLERKEADLLGWRQLAALEEVGEEIENCRAAWQWAIERHMWKELLRAADTFSAFCEIRTRLEEGDEAFWQAAEALEVVRNQAAAESPLIAEEIERTQGLMLAYQALYAFRLYRYDEAGASSQKGLELISRWGIDEGTAWVKTMAALSAEFQGSPQTESFLLESLDALRSSRPRLLGYIYWWLGGMGAYLKDLARARRLVQEGLAFHKDRGDRWGMGFAEFCLGEFAQAEGARREAAHHYRKSLEVRRELGDRWGVSICLDYLGYITREEGQFAEARQLHQDSLELSREIGDLLGIGGSLDDLGLVEYDERAYGEAEKLFQEGLALRRQVGDAWAIALSLGHLGAAALARGDVETAARRYLEWVESMPGPPDSYSSLLAQAFLGEIRLAQGSIEEARHSFCTALRAVAQSRIISDGLQMLPGISALLARTGRVERAAQVLVAVRHHPASTWATRVRAGQLLDDLASRLPPDAISLLEARAADVDLPQLIALLLEEL